VRFKVTERGLAIERDFQGLHPLMIVGMLEAEKRELLNSLGRKNEPTVEVLN
jgi:hypothetical protein